MRQQLHRDPALNRLVADALSANTDIRVAVLNAPNAPRIDGSRVPGRSATHYRGHRYMVHAPPIGKSGQLTLNAGKLFDQLSKILAYRYGSLAGGTAQASQATWEFRSPNIM
jgi:outer membrane protein TolC